LGDYFPPIQNSEEPAMLKTRKTVKKKKQISPGKEGAPHQMKMPDFE